MASPFIAAFSSNVTTTSLGGSPRSANITIGEPTGGQHRALIVWNDTRNGARAITGMTAGGSAMTPLGTGGAGTDTQQTPFIVIDPPTNGSGVCALGFVGEGGTGEYDPTYSWLLIGDYSTVSGYVDLTAGGAFNGSSNAPSSGSLTVAAGELLVSAMGQYFASTYSLTSAGATEHMHGSFLSRPYAIASRTTTGAFTWNASSSNAWRVTAILFKSDGGGGTPVSFSGTVPAQSAAVGTAFNLNLASYFSGTLTPFTYSLQAGSLAGTGLSLAGSVISGTPTGAGTISGLVVRATDAASNTADTNAFTITVAAAPAPVFTGPVSLLRYRANGFDISYPAGDGTVTGYEVSTDAGGSYTSVGTSLAPTIAAPLPGDPSRVRVRAFNAAGTRSTPVAVAQGVLGTTVPATGDFGAAALYAWLQANPSYMGSLVHAEVTRWPSLGTLVMNPDSSGSYTPAGDGEQSADIQPRVAGAATGVPFAIILRSGSGGDTDPPVMQGEIAVSGLTDTSFTTAVDPATDAVGVTGYQVSQDGGSTWIDKVLARTHTHAGLSPQTTYAVRWRARDAAGNWATPLAKAVTTQAAPIPPSGTIGRAWHFALLRRCAT